MSYFEIDYSDRKELGNTGEYVSAIGIGTWNIRNNKSMVEALKYAIELGLNMVDTAEMYGAGNAEEVVGQVVKEVGRDNIFITTKLMPDKFRSFEYASKATKASLKRLNTNYVDLLLIHWPEPYLSLRKTINILEKLVDNGLTRYIGVSNFDVSLLEEAITHLKKYEIVVNQVKYSVYDKSVEKGLLQYMISRGITLQAYTPIERGLVAKDDFLAKIGSKYNKTPIQVALNYLISHKRVVAIPKSEKRERIYEFKGALGWRLNLEDLKVLEKYYRKTIF